MNEPEHPQEQQFVQIAKSGDRRGVEALYQLYFDSIYRFCYWQTNRSEDAEDLTQDIFIEMAKSIRNFKGDSSFKNWLYIIAKRQVSNWIKQKYQLPIAPLFEMIPNQEDWIDPNNMEVKNQVVENLFNYLTDQERKIMTFRYLQNYTVKETAEVLYISEANVKVICHRCLKKLQKAAQNSS